MLEGELEILIDYSGEPKITLRGELDYRNRERVSDAISRVIEGGERSLQLDLKELVFMDSTGISALVDAAKSLLPKSNKIKLVSPSAQLVNLLSRAGLSELFGFVNTKTESKPADSAITNNIESSLEFEVPGRPEMVAHIRGKVGDFARAMNFTQEQIEDIKLAVGEASANAMRHGSNGNGCKVHIRVEKLSDELVINITDKGCGFDPDKVCPPRKGDLAEGGLGIMFMRALMDDVKFHFNCPGTRVEMTKKLNPLLS